LIFTSRTVETLNELVGEQSEKPLSQNVSAALGGVGGTLAPDGEFDWQLQNVEAKTSPVNNRVLW
jgi:hypothetical protein